MANLNKGSVRQLSVELQDFSSLIKKLHKELSKLEKGTNDYAEKQKQLNRAVADGVELSRKLGVANNNLNKSNKNHKKSISEATKAQNNFKETVDNTSKSVGKAAKTQDTFAKGIKSGVQTLLKYGIAFRLINIATQVFTNLTTGSVKEAIAFQKALANLSAVANVNGKDLQTLAENAEMVAGATKFTANEIVGLQTELSKLGFRSNEVVDATQGIAFAAQALGSPLDETAESIGKIINQFGLLKVEAGLVGDILVTTVNESALSFDTFGTAIQYVGPIAKQLNLSLEQTAGAMAVLADNGFTASRIGTGLRGILTEISKSSAIAEDELTRLSEANLSLSEAIDLVGKRNAAQLIVLLDNIEAIEDGTDKYYKQGRAIESAAKQSSSFAGQVELLNSAWNAFRRDLGKFVAESDIVVRLIGLVSKSAEEAARGFQVVSGFKGGELVKDLESTANGANIFSTAISRMSNELGVSEEKLSKMIITAREVESMNVEGSFFGMDSSPDLGFNEDDIRKTEGYITILQEQTDATLAQNAADEGRGVANNKYGDSVQRLITLTNAQFDVTKDIDTLHKEIEVKIDERKEALGKLNESEKIQITTISAEIEQYKQLQKTLVNISTTEERLADQRKKTTSDISDRYSELRETAFNQKSAREFNEIIDKAYADYPEKIKRANEELSELTIGTELYAKKVKEVDYLENLAKTIKEFELSEQDVFNIVKKLYDHILLGAHRENLEEFTKEFSKDISDALDKAPLPSLRPIISPQQKRYQEILVQEGKDAADAYLKGLEDKDFGFGERTRLEAFKSFQNLMLYLQENGTELANEVYTNILSERFNVLEDELDAEIELIKNRYELEGDILKSQLDNQLITESQFRLKKKELEKAQIRDENAVDKARFENKKKQDIIIASSNFAAAIAQSFINEVNSGTPFPANLINAAITSGGASIAYAGQLAAINQRKFIPQKFADGGVVNGPSHAQGGVPFSVQGRDGYEMEGGEFIVNKDATSKNYDLLRRINDSTRVNPRTGKMKFADGGVVGSTANESVDYLKAIAEATTSTAIGVSKPVRAFVADKDLRTDSNERRIRDRNDRI